MHARPRIPARPAALVALCLVVATLPGAASAQRVRVGPDAQLRTVAFEFPDGRSFSTDELRKQLAQPVLGKHARLRRTFGWLPFVDPVEAAPFDPVELQRDVVRLREFYRRAGFPNTDVQYDVRVNPEATLLDVRFRIRESACFRLTELVIAGPDSTLAETWLPADLQRSWRELAAGLAKAQGKRFGAEELRTAESAVRRWFTDHGYPFVTLRSALGQDVAQYTTRAYIGVEPGPRARIGDIEVVGTRRVDPAIVRKTLPFAPGDWYSAQRVTEGQRALVNLNLFNMAVAEAPPQKPDSIVHMRVRLEESKARLVTGELGYLSDAGITVKAEWASRNYFGGARNLAVSTVAQTGLWAFEDDPERLARGAVSLTQPGVIGRYVSLVTSPYVEYRDDYRDRSARVGFDATLVYFRDAWLRNASLQYGISSRRVYEYHSGAEDTQNIFDLLEAAFDSLGEHNNHSAVTIAAGFGRQDHPVRPSKLLMFRPSVDVTTPGSLNTAEYVRLDLSSSLQQPLHNRISFWGRAAIGRLYPYGKSIPQASGDDALERFLELGDYTFTAGGTGDVRGWESRLLGPKIPDIIADSLTQSTALRADRYVPVTALARVTLSGELRLPFPGLSAAWGTHVFLDGGKVWTPDPRYSLDDDYDQERFFFGTGFGIDRETPVGPVRFSAGWILNPSALDVLEPQEFLDAVEAGTLASAHTSWTRRLQLHLAIGSGF